MSEINVTETPSRYAQPHSHWSETIPVHNLLQIISRKSSLDIQMRTHTGEIAYQYYEYTICSKVFSQKYRKFVVK